MTHRPSSTKRRIETGKDIKRHLTFKDLTDHHPRKEGLKLYAVTGINRFGESALTDHHPRKEGLKHPLLAGISKQEITSQTIIHEKKD